MIDNQEFTDAWREVGECGIGSIKAITTVYNLIGSSELHRDRLTDIAKDVLRVVCRMAATFEEFDTPCGRKKCEAELRDSFDKTFHILHTLTAGAVVLGVILGVDMAATISDNTPGVSS